MRKNLILLLFAFSVIQLASCDKKPATLFELKDPDETKIYFVAETKDPKAAKDRTLLRDSERMKIACAEKHFEVLDGVEYKVVGLVSDLK